MGECHPIRREERRGERKRGDEKEKDEGAGGGGEGGRSRSKEALRSIRTSVRVSGDLPHPSSLSLSRSVWSPYRGHDFLSGETNIGT